MSNLKTFWILLDLKTTQKCNQFIYFLQKVPFLKRIVSDRWYRQLEFKGILFGLTLLVSAAISVLKSFAYFSILMGLVLFLPRFMSEWPSFFHKVLEGEPILIVQNLLVITSLVSFSLAQIQMISSGDSDLYLATRLLQIPPRSYLLMSEFIIGFQKVFLMTLGLTLAVEKTMWWQWLCFSVMVVGLRLFLRTLVFGLYDNERDDKTSLVTFLSLSSVGVLVGLILLWLAIGNLNLSVFFGTVALLVGVVLTLIAFYRLKNYTKLDILVRQIVTPKSIASLGQIIETVEVEQLTVKVDEIEIGDNQIQPETRGISYLSDLFVQRYGRLIRQKVFKRIKVMLALGVIINAIFYLTDWLDESSLQFWLLAASTLYIGFLIYLGEFLMKLTFYQMDRPLLRFRFYRQGDAIREILKTRFLMALRFNFPIFLTFNLLVFSIYFHVFSFQWQEVLMLFVAMIIGLLFFSLYHLYLYFLFQPFTTGMSSKSPTYNIINMIILGISYQLFRLDSAFSLSIIMGVMLAFLVVGYIAVKHFAPKTFMLK